MPDMKDFTLAYQQAGRKDDEDGYVPLARIKEELQKAVRQPQKVDNGKKQK